MSCSKEKTTLNGAVVNTKAEFSILNEDGDDLLNPATKGYLPFTKFKLYYLINGQKIAAQDFDSQIGGTNGMMLITEKQPYTLRCFTYCHGDEGLISEIEGIKRGIAIAYLEINDQITDTIKTEWIHKPGYFVNEKLWYNGELHEPAELVFKVQK
jgi:hypothetical protein